MLSGCTLELGSGQGLCCRDKAAVSATDCRLRAFGGACAAVLTGGSLELAGCTLNGGGGGGTAAATAAEAGGPGVLAEGKGSSLVARGSALVGFRGQAALVVTAGASVSLEDCRATDSGQGAVVGTRGGRLLAARCELSSNSSHGLAIGEGATADLRDCRLRGNGAAGLRVGGVGSMAVLHGCELSRNAGSGVAVAAGGCANLDGCTASANGAGAGAGTDGTQQQQEESGPGGAGLHVEGGGARVTALRCAFSANAGSGVRVGQYGSVQLLGCGVHGNKGVAAAGGNGSDTLAGVAGADRDGAGASGPCERWVVEVEVGPHGRATLSRGCSWGVRDGPGAEAGGAAGGPQGGLRAAELGCLEVLGDG